MGIFGKMKENPIKSVIMSRDTTSKSLNLSPRFLDFFLMKYIRDLLIFFSINTYKSFEYFFWFYTYEA